MTNIGQGLLILKPWSRGTARAISDGIMGALDTAIVFLEEFDWDGFADSISEFLANVDWGGIFGRLGLLLLEAFRGAFTVGNDLWQDFTSWLSDYFRSIGWDSVAGFFEGMAEEIRRYKAVLLFGFQTIIDWVKEKLGIHSPSTVFADIGKNVMQGLFNGISSMVDNVVSLFDQIKEKVVSVWNSLQKKTTEIWEGIKDAIKTPINVILGFIESFVNGIINGVNSAIGALNGLNFDIPDWIPGIGGKSLAFDIPELSEVSIPRLATGTVIPPNKEFMAVLGDNKREPEVVSPLSTMKQANKEAVMEALSELGITAGNNRSSGNETFVFQVDGKTFFEII